MPKNEKELKKMWKDKKPGGGLGDFIDTLTADGDFNVRNEFDVRDLCKVIGRDATLIDFFSLDCYQVDDSSDLRLLWAIFKDQYTLGVFFAQLDAKFSILENHGKDVTPPDPVCIFHNIHILYQEDNPEGTLKGFIDILDDNLQLNEVQHLKILLRMYDSHNMYENVDHMLEQFVHALGDAFDLTKSMQTLWDGYDIVFPSAGLGQFAKELGGLFDIMNEENVLNLWHIACENMSSEEFIDELSSQFDFDEDKMKSILGCQSPSP